MKRFLTKYGLTMLALAAAIAVILSVMTYFSSTAAVLPNLAGIAAAPFRNAGAAVTEQINAWFDYLTNYDALKAENEALKLQIAQMEEENRQAKSDREENARLRELMNLQEQRRDLTFAAARVVESDYSNWASMLTINKGTGQDINVGDCVITETGCLVGVVTEAGLNWSTVRTVLDSDTSIGALIFRSGVSAVAQGEFSLMSEGRLRLAYLGTRPDVVSGDLVVTSGLAGYYPSQLVIGYVEELTAGDDGMDQYAIIVPSVDLDGLTEVFVVTSFDIVE